MKDKKNILQALFKVQGELNHVAKTADNPFFKSKYADLPAVIDFVKPVLQKHGIGFTHLSNVIDGAQHLDTYLFHVESGEFLMGRTLLKPTKNDPQGYGSAITYARRYDLTALLGLAQDDDDGNGASKRLTAKECKEISAEIGAMLEHATNLDELAAIWKREYRTLKDLGDAHVLYCEQIKDDMKAKLGE